MSALPSSEQPSIGTRSKGTITVDGLLFRDLDGDGELSAYEDWRLSAGDRKSVV